MKQGNFIYLVDIGTKYTNIHIVEKNGKGYIRAGWFDNDNVLTISDLLVEPSSRKKGVGGELIKKAENITGDYGIRYIELKVLKDSWMRKWYERLGYNLLYIEDNNEYACLIKDTIGGK